MYEGLNAFEVDDSLDDLGVDGRIICKYCSRSMIGWHGLDSRSKYTE